MAKATVATTPIIRRLNHLAIREGRNRALSKDAILALDEEGIHLLVFSMVHNDVEMRTQWMLKLADRDAAETAPIAYLDMSFEDFGRLPTLETVHDPMSDAPI